MNLYSVHDKAAKTHTMPIALETDRDAIEGFKNVVQAKDTQYSKFPADFTLIRIGTYDRKTAKIETTQYEIIATGTQFTLTETNNND